MLRYILKRFCYSLLTLFVLVTITFLLMQLLPGDPFLGEKALPENIKQAQNARYGLDQPLHVQYLKYLGNIACGDLGDSMLYQNRSVKSIIAQAFPYSFDLGIRALIFAVVAGILLGAAAGANRGKVWDTVSVVIAVIGVSVPGFIMGSVLQYFISLKLQQFLDVKLIPIGGWDTELHKIIPPFALGLPALASIARIMRASMLEVVGADYIKTARAKGLSEHCIVWKHCIRNAVLPVMTMLGPLSATILTGTFIVENIFNIPGLGRFFIQSVQMTDYTMIMGLTLFYGAFLIVANMLVDIVYGIIDPRIRLGKGKG